MVARKCRIIGLVFGLLVNTLDFISDWLFYVSTKQVEQGLVYGPVDPQQVLALLVFSIIGSVGFVVEILVFIFELRKGEDHHGDFLLDLVSALIIWIEDIPQVLISFSIALCREEPVSIFQLTKAGLVLVGVVISVIAGLVRLCRKYESSKKLCCLRVIRIILFLGILIEGVFAGAIFALTQTESDTDGNISFRVPTTVMEDHLNDHRYLSNVNLFVHHADLFDSWNMDTNKKESNMNWLRLVSLHDLKDNNQLSFKLNYQHVGIQVLTMSIWNATNKQAPYNWLLSECYSLNHNTAEVTLLQNTTCEDDTLSSNNSETFFMTFQFEQPSKSFFYRQRVFGEIYFNMKVLSNGVCSDGNYEDPFHNRTSHYFPLTFHYFRVNTLPNISDVAHLYTDGTTNPRFFRKNSQDMVDVAEVWKTGWNRCTSTGSLSPVLERNIPIGCD